MIKKILLISSLLVLSLIIFLISAVLFCYLYFIPNLIQNPKLITKAQDLINNYSNSKIVINKPYLKTGLNTKIIFKIDDLYLKKDKKVLLNLVDFSIALDFRDIFDKKIKLNSIYAKKLDLDINEFLKFKLKNLPKTKENKSLITLDYLGSDIKLDELSLVYSQKNNSKINVQAKNIKIQLKQNQKLLSFDLSGKILKNNKIYVNFNSKANSNVKIIDDKQLNIENLKIILNSSKVFLSAKIDLKNYKINIKSNDFLVKDVFNIINSNFVIENGEQMLSILNSPKGKINFDIDYKNQNLSGKIKILNSKADIKDINNLPITIKNGVVTIYKDKLIFSDFLGYWGKKQTNLIEIKGEIKDYYKTFNSNIVIDTVLNNEFYNDYLYKLTNVRFKQSQNTKTKIVYKALNNVMNITWLALIPKGVEFSIENNPAMLTPFDRCLIGKFNINKNKLKIEKIDYYITQKEPKKGMSIKPVLTIDGNMDLSGKINELGFEFSQAIPCEFLNIFVGAKTFKKGTIQGKLHVVYKNNIPILKADMKIDKTLIPSQRIFIKEAILTTTNNYINFNLKGGFKKVRFDFVGKLKNELNPPIIVENFKLNIEKLDLEKFLASMNTTQNKENSEKEALEINSQEDIKDDNFMVDTSYVKYLQIKEGDFSLKNGNYKDLTFGNILAKISLNEKGILNIQSNKFDIAQGISTLKINFDIPNLKYYLRLGVKDVDSNLMSKVLLNLDKQISGLACGLIELNSDKSMKLNGQIKFLVKDGTIEKIGLVEYLLKIASVFRNPIVMINPATIIDIISIPEGKFDKISGDLKLKDNVVNNIKIVSTSNTLSALVKGRFDLNEHDASLRIYTRFSTNKNTIFGFLRNISLNSLANKVKFNSKNDENYYSAELEQLPAINVENSKTQVFLTTIEGDIEHNNYLSSLKKIK